MEVLTKEKRERVRQKWLIWLQGQPEMPKHDDLIRMSCEAQLAACQKDSSVKAKCGLCGGEMSKNPHPDAGKPPMYVEVGTQYVCVPCTCKSRHQWAERAMIAEGKLKDRLSKPELREKIKDIVHGTLATKGVTRWRSGYRDEEMESWLNEIADQILLDLPDEEEIRKYIEEVI